MSIMRRAVAAVATVALSGSLAVAAATPAAADLYESGVYSLPYTDTLWRVDAPSNQFWQVTYSEWQKLGFPTPKPAATEFVKYSWSPTVYAVTMLGDEQYEWIVRDISYSEWARAGYPQPRVTSSIPGGSYVKFASSDELFAVSPSSDFHKLTYQEWQTSGFPQPERWSVGYVQFPGDVNIYYAWNFPSTEDIWPISYEMWSDYDFPTPYIMNR